MVAVRKGKPFSARCFSGPDDAARIVSPLAGLAQGTAGRKRITTQKDVFFPPQATPAQPPASVRRLRAGRLDARYPPLHLAAPRAAAATGGRAAATRRPPCPPSTPGSARDLVDDLPSLCLRGLRAGAREALRAPRTHRSVALPLALREHRLREPCAAAKLRRGLDPLVQARKLAPCSSPSSTSSKRPACR